MILAKVVADGKDHYYVVSDVTHVYRKLVADGLHAQSVEILTDDLKVDLSSGTDDPNDYLIRCCALLGVDLSDVRGPNRQKKLVLTRRVIVYAMHKKFPEMSLLDLGDTMYRDHTTMIHSLRKIEEEKEAGLTARLLEKLQL